MRKIQQITLVMLAWQSNLKFRWINKYEVTQTSAFAKEIRYKIIQALWTYKLLYEYFINITLIMFLNTTITPYLYYIYSISLYSLYHYFE